MSQFSKIPKVNVPESPFSIYYWSQQLIPALPSTIDPLKKNSFEIIKSRLKNWYCDETKTTSSFSSPLKERWNSLLKSVKKAHQNYHELDFHEGKIVGPPLFCRDCRYPQKFGTIMEQILLPLALEYYMKSRTNEIAQTAATQRSELNSGNSTRRKNAWKAIAGESKHMFGIIKKKYLPASSAPFTAAQIESAINTLNFDRLNHINNLLDFVKEQGFADGSGLGSLNHEMNMDDTGFMHTLFLLSDSLSKPSNESKLKELINTTKWYNDFGEVYQSPTFEIKGTTADRMITLTLFRLIIVLAMPSVTDADIKAKIRDMEALVRWLNNALAVNEGLGGVMKPDFTGYHHLGLYGPAYVPQALQTASLVQYLLGGTAFSLSATSVNNIRQGLETLRLIAVKYSTPNSVNGRFPDYFNKALMKTVLPGYAYISVLHPPVVPSAIPKGIHVTNVTEPEMFLRLYRYSEVKSVLEQGSYKAKYFFNSLGSLSIMDAVSITRYCFLSISFKIS